MVILFGPWTSWYGRLLDLDGGADLKKSKRNERKKLKIWIYDLLVVFMLIIEMFIGFILFFYHCHNAYDFMT